MEQNVFENPIEVRTSVTAPHFNDRRVVQRAQRVVPLNEIRTQLRLRRLLYLGGAFAIAMVLGAASALLAVHLKRSASTVTQIQLANTDDEIVDPEPVHVDPVIETSSVEETPVEPVVTKKQTPVAVRPRVVVRDNGPNDRGVAPSEEEQLEQIREAVLYEQWQERRARRATRRERRNRGDRDLSQVDEIFEGPRRPERP